jgi:hypothetical protein
MRLVVYVGGRPACFARNCCLIWSGLGPARIGVHVRCPKGGEDVLGDDLLGGGGLRRFRR